eukprot:TCALIF_10283-PA protein Name:"Similar to LCP16/17 Larval cuticle protein 16/17 (Manduca sexta)" AED:0.06 eAED:0.06 QI:0/0/0/0.75/0.33/0.25/4/0/517
MNKFVAVLSLIVAVASGARIPRDSGYSQSGSQRSNAQAQAPIGIVSSVYNGPTAESQNFDFAFETENGIRQEATGEMKTIDDTEVVVMRGSYTYLDAEGRDVTVTWEADENGYRAESDILPVAPEIPFEEQRQAVAAQIAFAQQEEQAAAASSTSNRYAPAPANSYSAAAPAAPTSQYGARIPRDSGYSQSGSQRGNAHAQAPIGIVSSVYNGPTAESQNFDFAFETENGIRQEATGEMKTIDDTEVVVMRGSYTYLDAEGRDVTVTWEADENGYRAESDILPVAPEIPFEEQRQAVAAQIAFAQQEEQAAAASSTSNRYAPAPANSYSAAAPAAPTSQYGARIPRDSGYSQSGSQRGNAQAQAPIGIVSSVYNGPTAESQNFDFAFETENGIRQEATGEMKTIDDTEVVVMRGSYTYLDAEGRDVTVTWEADENGYRAESDILPVAPEIPFEEQRQAVAAQIAFAQQEEQAAAASSTSNRYAPAPANSYSAAAPAAPTSQYGAASPAQPTYTRYNY